MSELLKTFETTVLSSNSSASVGIYTIMEEITSTLATSQFGRFLTIHIIKDTQYSYFTPNLTSKTLLYVD